MFIVVLFTIANTWKESKCLLMDEWIKKLCVCVCVCVCVYAMKYYSTINNNEILPFVTIWLDLEGIILSEVDKDRHSVISLMSRI